MRTKRIIGAGVLATTLGLCQAAFADTGAVNHKHLGSAAQQQAAAEWNSAPHAVPFAAWNVSLPYSEAETTGYVAISGDDDFELPQLRQAIAQNLPADVTLIVYVGSSSAVPQLKQQLGQYLGDRLKFVQVPNTGDPIWARDSLPFPVHLSSGGYGLVASIYPQNFDPNDAIRRALNLSMVRTNQYFRGGNLLFDQQGNCFSENVNETASLRDPETFFKQYFGCKTVTLLDQEGGIGDIDERIKFLGGNEAMADDETYAQLLRSRGYNVHMIPQPGGEMETYMNTLIVNGTIFVPQMGVDNDQAALDAYRQLGFKPVGVYTRELADQGNGNIHCTTMNYPKGTFVQSPTNPDFVQFR